MGGRTWAALLIAASTVLVVPLARPGPAGAAGRQAPQDLADRAEAEFADGRIQASVDTYDQLARIVPDTAPWLWQRGIALYELGRYDECARQFAAYHEASPQDLESVAWHYFCQARIVSPAIARRTLLAAGSDPRVLRAEIYEMIAGRRTPASLLALADASVSLVRFYAHLYVGFYLEVEGRASEALREFEIAASPPYVGEGGFMNVVARIHLARLHGRADPR